MLLFEAIYRETGLGDVTKGLLFVIIVRRRQFPKVQVTSRTNANNPARPRRTTKLLHRHLRLVSFDVFGTALDRRLVEAGDIHYLTANRIGLTTTENVDHYVSCRRAAEERAREKAAESGRTEVGIAEISSELEEFLPPELFGKKPIQTELQLEQELAVANPDVLAFHQKVRRKGLSVVFTADTSLPHGLVARMLRSAGYDWDHLFLSSQTGRTKQDGSLFSSVVERTSFQPSQILHIGETQAVDVTITSPARLSVREPVALTSPVELSCERRTGVDSVALALAANHQAKVADKVTPADVGYYSLGPMMSGFVGWVAWQTRRKLPDHVLLAPRLHPGKDLVSRIGSELSDLIRPSHDLWAASPASSDDSVQRFLDESGVEPGDNVALLDLGWDDKNVSHIESLMPEELNISVAGFCLGLFETPTSNTKGWAFSPDRNIELAKRMRDSEFVNLLGSPRRTTISDVEVRRLIEEISIGIIAFAEDMEPWINLGPTTASLCWPALRTIESPTYAEAQRLTDGWTRKDRSIGRLQVTDSRPLKSRLVRSVQLRSELASDQHLGSVWEQGSRVLESGGSVVPALPVANKRLALRSLRIGQRRGNS